MQKTSTRGFTLVELLVVIAIIGVLVALLLPAVQSAREAARRTQCTNNLKQIGLALQNYHAALSVFPSGYIANSGTHSQRTVEEGWGWHVLIMPYMEQTGLYDQLEVRSKTLQQRLSDAASDAGVKALFQTELNGYLCPSDERSATLDPDKRHFYGLGNKAKIAVGKTNYPGVAGLFDRAWNWQGNSVSGGTGPFENNGALFGNSEIRMADIRDGTSNTFAVGERDMRCYAASWPGVRNPSWDCNWGIWHNLGIVRLKPNSHEDPVFRAMPSKPNDARGTWQCDSCTETFSSAHPGGILFAFCDGSVHFISDGIDSVEYPAQKIQPYDPETLGTYQHLGVRNDGQVISGDFY
ncbi:MAG: DUF1559 domain-containing protein [Planctomycetales bacterium]|nr:DUF1559 domain-containing protein [Planctomycetales bacterium]